MTTSLAFQSPNKYRLETTIELNEPEKDNTTSVVGLMGFDGLKSWGYRPTLNIYATGDASPLDADAMGIGPFRDPLGDFQRQNGKAIHLAQEERCATPEGERDCFLVELVYSYGRRRLWIEKTSYHVVRVEQFGSTYIFKKIELNTKLPDVTFRFTPPTDARRADQLP